MKFAVIRVSPKRWQVARQHTSTGRLGTEHLGGEWINDATNDRLDDWVVEEIEAARNTALGIQAERGR